MTDDELDRLADLIARALLTTAASRPPTAPAPRAEPWVPAPVRPEPPTRSETPPIWSGAAQNLADLVAPRLPAEELRYRVPTADLTRATRAAAAGKGPPPTPVRGGPNRGEARPRARTAPTIDVRVGVSNRHVHLSPPHLQSLFGGAPLTPSRPLTQPGQFAADQVVAVEGPGGRIDHVRVVGPPRAETQLEIAASDAALLGVQTPVAASGSLDDSAGGLTLVGPAGRVPLARGVIIAARHLHLSPGDARRWGLRDGDRLDVRAGTAARGTTFHDVLVRAGAGHATELHLDVDEARAAGLHTGDTATVVAWRAAAGGRRPLVTERDVVHLARTGGRLPANAILTPSARDRASALGLLER